MDLPLRDPTAGPSPETIHRFQSSKSHTTMKPDIRARMSDLEPREEQRTWHLSCNYDQSKHYNYLLLQLQRKHVSGHGSHK
jgi:hypothetical protein